MSHSTLAALLWCDENAGSFVSEGSMKHCGDRNRTYHFSFTLDRLVWEKEVKLKLGVAACNSIGKGAARDVVAGSGGDGPSKDGGSGEHCAFRKKKAGRIAGIDGTVIGWSRTTDGGERVRSGGRA